MFYLVRLIPERLAFVVAIVVLCFNLAYTQSSKKDSSDPEIMSVFPLAGQQGTTWTAEVRGRGLAGAYAVWFDCDALRAEVKTVETVEIERAPGSTEVAGADKPKRPGQRVLLELETGSSAQPGLHRFRILSSLGISNSFPVFVGREPVVLENLKASTAVEPQRISVPAAVSGRIGKEGEIDYFAIEVAANRWLRFDANSAVPEVDPVITLFEPSGSWFDPGRLKRLAYNDDAARSGSSASLSYRFRKSGRYVIGVAAFLGLGGPDYAYRLRVADSSQEAGGRVPETETAHPALPEWRERSFSRPIEPDRLRVLWSRGLQARKTGAAVEASAADSSASQVDQRSEPPAAGALAREVSASKLPIVSEREPNDSNEVLNVSLPAIIEGTIDRPEDQDHYRFHVSDGQTLVLEIETHRETPPAFNPFVEVFSQNGEEILNNVYQQIGGDGDDWVQSLEAKCLYSFSRAGDFILRVRDQTSRNGSPNFAYRLLIRPQIPHVGEMVIKEEQLNLVPGRAKKVTVTAGQEEGFDGQISLAVENLPLGVVALPAADLAPAVGPPFAKVHPERFVPKTQTVTLVLLANADAPATRAPFWARITARPIVDGKPGPALAVKELPVMVVNPVAGGGKDGMARR
ncbi:MAG: hypothetical protein FJW26_15570 [Acidimicrobiia bacterium]|nr:hypothetical protein [Acidimicrobiia bacterium]